MMKKVSVVAIRFVVVAGADVPSFCISNSHKISKLLPVLPSEMSSNNTDDDTDENSGGMYILSVVYHNLACYRCSRYINIVAFRVFWKKRKS